MKIIEFNLYGAMILAFMAAGIGALISPIFNIPPLMIGIVYMVSSVALYTTLKKKDLVFIKFR